MAVIGGIFVKHVLAASKHPVFAAGRIGSYRFHDPVAFVLRVTSPSDTDKKYVSSPGPAG